MSSSIQAGRMEAPSTATLSGVPDDDVRASREGGGFAGDQSTRGDHLASPSETPSRLGVLRHKYFRRVWIASFVSNSGNWMEMVGIQMIVAKETGSLKMLGYFAAAGLMPILLFGVFGGLVADRVNRRTLLMVTQAILMVLAGLVAVVSIADMSWLRVGFLEHLGNAQGLVAALFIISILQGTVAAFNIPAWQVLTPRLVPKDELTRAIMLNGIQFNASRVIGPAFAGAILAAWGATPLFMINTVTFLGVVIAVTRTPDAPAPKRNAAAKSAWPEIREALAFIFLRKGPRCVFIAMVVMSLFASPLMRMLPLYVIDVYGLAESAADGAMATLISMLGVGAVVGGLALKYVPAWYPKHHFIPASLAGAGLTITVFAATTTLWAGYVAMFFVGLFWIWGFNPSWAAMQNLVSDHMRGRVLAVANVASFGVMAVGNIAAGWLGEGVEATLKTGRFGEFAGPSVKALGTHAAVGAMSLALLMTGIVMMIWRVPEVDGMNPGDRAYGPPRRNLWDAITARAHHPLASPPAEPSMADERSRDSVVDVPK
ncbi:MAG: MFS transporter [Phycisphaerales bacterium]|nr:MFS transporter [Phycisphaerales bacterium]